jgi:hypothetical protein
MRRYVVEDSVEGWLLALQEQKSALIRVTFERLAARDARALAMDRVWLLMDLGDAR